MAHVNPFVQCCQIAATVFLCTVCIEACSRPSVVVVDKTNAAAGGGEGAGGGVGEATAEGGRLPLVAVRMARE